MTGGDWAFAALAANPVGGLMVAVPFAALELRYPLWRTVLWGVPLAYLQVLAVDLGWSALSRLDWWNRLLERRRSPRAESLMASRGGFWAAFLATPFIGPWFVMACMRYAQVPQRRVVLPITLALACTAVVVWTACRVVPAAFAR